MWGLFFEMRAKPGHWDAYFDQAARLRPRLTAHPGLLYLERFRRLDGAAVLSHQHWRDAAAIAGWRADPEHLVSQRAGRHVHFEDYRIRLGPEAAPGTIMAAFGSAPVAEDPGAVAFESVTRPGRFVTLIDLGRGGTAAPGDGTDPRGDLAARPGIDRLCRFAVARDYGMHDRRQAPPPL